MEDEDGVGAYFELRDYRRKTGDRGRFDSSLIRQEERKIWLRTRKKTLNLNPSRESGNGSCRDGLVL